VKGVWNPIEIKTKGDEYPQEEGDDHVERAVQD